MNDVNEKGFTEILRYLPMRFQNILVKLPSGTKCSIKEIRLRANKPVVAVTEKGCAFLASNSKLSYILNDTMPVITVAEIDDTVKKVCGFSVYTHQNEIVNGFVTLAGGHRVGLCGTAVCDDKTAISIRDINCINIRIANEKAGSAAELISKIFYSGLQNIIIAGAPMSGKTTVLRDLVRQISDGNAGEYYKCAVMDERCEIAAVNGQVFENNVGCNTDVLSNYPKSLGISQAIRTLSPDIIFCDETATECEVDEILNGIMCGVHFAVTVHGNNFEDLLKRNISKRLLNSGLFGYVVLLGERYNLGKIEKIMKVGEIDLEKYGNYDNISDLYSCG